MMHRVFSLLFIGALFQAGWGEECRSLDLQTAWQRVLAYAPSIAAADAEIGIRDAEARQVSLLPNPIAVVEGENLGVKNHDDEAEPPETTFALSQLIEFGGKRRARRAFAFSLKDIAYLDSQIERLDMRFTVMTALLDVSIAQEKLKLAYEKEELAVQILDTFGMLVDGGKISPIQEKKAQVALMTAKICVRAALADLGQTRTRLSSLWGSSCPDFDCVLYELFDCSPPPCQNRVIENLAHTPDFAKAEQEILAATKNLKLQKANGIPDVTLTLGYSVFNDSGQHGWIIGAEMPLPFFNCNQGNIQRARVEITQAEYQMDEVVRVLRERVLLIHERLVAAFEEGSMIKQGVLAEALETFDLIHTGYQEGKLELLDLLEAKKMLFEIQEQYIDILYEYHLNKAELARFCENYEIN